MEIAAGPDGNLWFIEGNVDKIGRISPSGAITEFPVPTVNSGLVGITAGSDGNLWFTENARDVIGRITPAGDITEFRLPDAGISPTDITAGPDGNLWFLENNLYVSGVVHFGDKIYKIGRINPAGTITEFPIHPIGDGELQGITAGPDGNLWFIGSSPTMLGRIQT